MDLKTIIEQISNLIVDKDFITVANIATLSEDDGVLPEKSNIILSIVNIQEDKTLKNQSIYQKKAVDNTINQFAHPTKYLVFTLLFASYNTDQSKYLDGLGKLQMVIDYFQQNNSFYYNIADTVDTEVITFPIFDGKTEEEKENYSKITFNSVSLSLDQTNQMWSYLGSKYMPSVLYEIRILPIQKNESVNSKGIEEIKINMWGNNKNDPTGLLESITSE